MFFFVIILKLCLKILKMRSIAIISLFALIAICSANRYQIQVKLVENGFETVNGTLKLIIGRNAFNSNIYRFNKT